MKILPAFLLLTTMGVSILEAEVQFQGTEGELSAKIGTLPRLVNLTGTAEIRTNANRARIDLLVTTEKRSLDDALAENAAKRSALATALQKGGFAADQIQNSDFASSQRPGVFTEKVRSYKIENHLIVTIRTPEQFREFARQADRHPDAVVQSIEFDHTDEKTLRRKAVEEALADAGLQSAVYEKALGLRLSPRGFSEVRAIPFGVELADYSGLQKSVARYSAAPASAAEGESRPGFAFGELVFNSTISVQYLAEPQR